LLFLGQGGGSNPAEKMEIKVDATDNIIENSLFGVFVIPVEFSSGNPPPNTAERFISLEIEDNSYIANFGNNVGVSFQTFQDFGGLDARNSTVIVDDGDGFFPDLQMWTRVHPRTIIYIYWSRMTAMMINL
jgi:hypothetical protein